jgi:hypothetical protein
MHEIFNFFESFKYTYFNCSIFMITINNINTNPLLYFTSTFSLAILRDILIIKLYHVTFYFFFIFYIIKIILLLSYNLCCTSF